LFALTSPSQKLLAHRIQIGGQICETLTLETQGSSERKEASAGVLNCTRLIAGDNATKEGGQSVIDGNKGAESGDEKGFRFPR